MEGRGRTLGAGAGGPGHINGTLFRAARARQAYGFGQHHSERSGRRPNRRVGMREGRLGGAAPVGVETIRGLRSALREASHAPDLSLLGPTGACALGVRQRQSLQMVLHAVVRSRRGPHPSRTQPGTWHGVRRAEAVAARCLDLLSVSLSPLWQASFRSAVRWMVF